MAKLSARGRRELLRYHIDYEVPEEKRQDEYSSIRRKISYAIMSDGNILRKIQAWAPPGPYDHGKPQKMDWGWKRYKKIKRKEYISTYVENTRKKLANPELLEKGWRIEC